MKLSMSSSSFKLLARLLASLIFACVSTGSQAQDHDASKPGNAAHKRSAMAIDAAFAPTGELWVVGLDSQARLNVQISSDAGKSWVAPRILDSGADKIAAQGESRPRLAFGPNGWVVIAYVQPLAKKFTGEVRMLRSTDGGKTFSAPFTVHQDRQLIAHRFVSIGFDASGNLHSLWIDKRDAELTEKTGAKNPASYRGAAIYHNVSSDGGATFGKDLKLADHSCECCRIGLARTSDGKLAAMWRHVFAPNVRDHAFAVLGDSAPAGALQRSTFDEWKVDACPHHGPALSPFFPAAGVAAYHAVWFGNRNGLAQVRYGQLDRNGAPLTPPAALPDESAEHADVLSAGKKVVIAWRSYDGSGMNLKAWRSDDEGRNFTFKQLARTTQDSDYPVLAGKGAAIFIVWNTRGKIYVERF